MTISDIDRTPIYPTTEFTIEKLTRKSTLAIENSIELPKLPNNVGDRWFSNGSVEKKVGKFVLNGSENWSFAYHPSAGYLRFDLNGIPTNSSINLNNTNDWISNLFESKASEISECLWINNNITSIVIQGKTLIGYGGFVYGSTSTYVPAFKDWLNQNNVVVYYTLAEPIIENAPILPEFIDFYEGGSVIVDEGIIDYTVVGNQAQINYIEGNITTVVDRQFKISKPTTIITYNLYNYDLSTLPDYFEYGSLAQGTYDNVLEFNDNNQKKQIKLFFDDNIQDSRYNIYLENNTIVINNDTEVIRIYNDNTYTSTRNLDTDITYKLEGYNIIGYIDGKFDNTVLAFFWVIPALLVGGLIYLLLKRKE